MGLGKSSVITPIILSKICNSLNYDVAILVVPSSLLKSSIVNVMSICCNMNIYVIESIHNNNVYNSIKNNIYHN